MTQLQIYVDCKMCVESRRECLVTSQLCPYIESNSSDRWHANTLLFHLETVQTTLSSLKLKVHRMNAQEKCNEEEMRWNATLALWQSLNESIWVVCWHYSVNNGWSNEHHHPLSVCRILSKYLSDYIIVGGPQCWTCSCYTVCVHTDSWLGFVSYEAQIDLLLHGSLV